MLDLLIKNGNVVSPDDTITMDVGIKDGKIVVMGSDLEKTVEAERVIDATGKYVCPGGIDPHVHFELPFQGATTVDDFFEGSRAAAMGGTTMFIDFVTQAKGQMPMEAVSDRYELSKKACTDYALHMIMTDCNSAAIADMKNVVDFGISSFKCYMLYKANNLMAEAGDMLAAMKESKKLGCMFGAHAESSELTEYNVAKALEEGHREPIWHAITKDNIVEAEGIYRALFLADVAGCGYYNFHTACAEGVDMFRKAKADGKPYYAETCTHYLVLTDEKLKGEHGERYICSPPLRPKEHQDALWEGLADGTIRSVSSDEAAFNTEMKNSKGDCFVDVPNGGCGLEFRVPLVYSEGVAKGRFSINKFVEVTSTNSAKIFGFYPQKGIIAVGSDADITIIDPDVKKTLTLDDMQINTDYNPYEGVEVTGWPIVTIAAGKVIVENGEFKGERGAGRFLKMPKNMESLTTPIV